VVDTLRKVNAPTHRELTEFVRELHGGDKVGSGDKRVDRPTAVPQNWRSKSAPIPARKSPANLSECPERILDIFDTTVNELKEGTL
jgi:hypothetical protein